MEDTFDAHNDKSLDNLLKDSENLWHSKLFVFLFVVVQEISFLAVLHDYFQLFTFLVKVRIIYFDKVGMYKLFHDLDLFQSLVSFERVDVDTF